MASASQKLVTVRDTVTAVVSKVFLGIFNISMLL